MENEVGARIDELCRTRAKAKDSKNTIVTTNAAAVHWSAPVTMKKRTLSPPENPLGAGTTTDLFIEVCSFTSESNTLALCLGRHISKLFLVTGLQISHSCSMASLNRNGVSQGPKSFKEQRMAWTGQDRQDRS